MAEWRVAAMILPFTGWVHALKLTKRRGEVGLFIYRFIDIALSSSSYSLELDWSSIATGNEEARDE